MTVKAKTFWVWTDRAEKDNPNRSRSGHPIWHHYQHQAPKKWLTDGLIIDSQDYIKVGQVTLDLI